LEFRKNSAGRNRDLPDDVKQCSGCLRILPRTTDHFIRASKYHDGLQTNCRNCRHDYLKHWNSKRVRK
jgi:hypothetical protein